MASSWVWFAQTTDDPGDAWAAAAATDAQDGERAGWLAVWRDAPHRPAAHALRADARLFDRAGEPALVSLTLAGDRRLLYDDLAVQRARQLIYEDPRLGAVTTLSASPSHIGGALVLARGPDAAAVLRDDPFARLLPRRLLTVGAGLLGAPLPPPGPVVERYAGAPWPAGRF